MLGLRGWLGFVAVVFFDSGIYRRGSRHGSRRDKTERHLLMEKKQKIKHYPRRGRNTLLFLGPALYD